MVNSNRYNKYLSTILIGFETLLCGALFLVYVRLTQDTNYEKVLISPTIQVTMMVMLIYAVCASMVGVVCSGIRDYIEGVQDCMSVRNNIGIYSAIRALYGFMVVYVCYLYIIADDTAVRGKTHVEISGEKIQDTWRKSEIRGSGGLKQKYD